MQSKPLTRFPEGSIRELWSISLPLMISTLATLFMIFTDRIFLAHYSTDALNASVNAGTLAWAMMAGFGMITAMSEVFVAQYNGAKKYEKIGVPVWQMIWFALFSYLFFIPMALWGAPHIFAGDRYFAMEVEYFRWLLLFAPSYALLTAFAGFFIGQGKTKVMIALAIFANIINIGLDWALIFGVEGLIPQMGIRGAAIATCFGYFFESAVLAYLFLKKKNRVEFGAGKWQIDFKEMKKCLKVGLPQGIFCSLEVLGWAVFYWMMTSLSEHHITVSSICQSFVILLSFFLDGLSRGSTAVAGNLIGAKKHEMVHKVLRSGLILLLFFTLAVSLVLVFNPIDSVKFLFFDGTNPTIGSELQDSVAVCMLLAFIYLFFDGVRWVFAGLLIAAGDTVFLLIFGSLSVWVFLLLPIYLVVVQQNLSVEYAWGITAGYAVLFTSVYMARFMQGKWKKINLVEESLSSHKEADMPLEEASLLDPGERS